jgi:hypothetical protein
MAISKIETNRLILRKFEKKRYPSFIFTFKR